MAEYAQQTAFGHPQSTGIGNGPAGICSEIEGMEKSIAELHEVISGLESRLTPVTRPATPMAENNSRNLPESNQSGLLDRIQRQVAAIRGASARISNLHSRVDL